MQHDDARRVIARAPTRIDLGGGWTDVPPYTVEQGGCVCNIAIARYAVAMVSRASGASSADPLVEAARHRARATDVRIQLDCDFPISAGLGGSSAAGVALAGALAGWQSRSMSRDEIAEWSRATEIEELGVAGGSQDHYAAAYGGALGLWFDESVRVRQLQLADETRAAIERRCIVAYTGQSRISGNTITAVLDAYRAREPRVTQALARMKALAEQMIVTLEEGDVDALAELVGEHWVHQRALHPSITTPEIERLMDAARSAGAIGGKALGASGGGCVAVFAPEGRVDAVRAVVAELAEPLTFEIDVEGVHVE